uniref:Uncharacterized protein n=1 Tax=viral metagenome TaxID=1070528 RepID=A0A6M3XY27_9ZZZZ
MRVKYNRDLKFAIHPRKFPEGITPRHPQFECVINSELPELNDICKKCMFCGISHKRRQAIELGINGYMSNTEKNAGKISALEPNSISPTTGLNLRDPRTIIIQEGDIYTCRNKKASAEGTYELGPDLPSCEHFKNKIVEK